ncbi:integrase catalytic domain-containing protein [Candidatus Cryosericum terrychapinii]|uniref:integrase catalytic domain-containing protein n=1 Tax=Candidatus Cryosericum terrychapinii TaxID=2290919 RepID=UPI000E5BC65F|nr:DDE-type integrase/transposase/recombinase [Candidatus Cryosericum terrychapinii]
MDLVTHEGCAAGGEYACALDITDVATGWTETRAVRNKSQEHVVIALSRIRSNLPALVLHSDKGSEFINDQLGRSCDAHCIRFARSRPWGEWTDSP